MKKKVLRIQVCTGFGWWFWKLVSKNGEILAHSECYKSKAAAMKTAKLIKGASFEIEVVK